MPLLVLKVVLTPLLIGGATLAARRWGPVIGGLFIALPLTSGPILFFMAIDQGPAFTQLAAVGTTIGLAAIAAYCVAYARADRRVGPGASLAAASAAFVVTGVMLHAIVGAPLWLVVAITVLAIAGATRAIPFSGVAHGPLPHPAWDLPARMIVATTLVVAITALAPVLGPGWSGIVATFPVYLSVMAVFTHRHAGAAAADDVLRGILAGLYGTVAFYVVVAVGLGFAAVGITFVAAVATALAFEAAALRVLRPGVEPEPA
jgi:hypothetical protein